jgi:hypothetical protein
VRQSKRRHTGGLGQRTVVGTLGGAEPIAEHRRPAEVRVKGGRRPSRSDAEGALDAGRSRPDARLSVRGRYVSYDVGNTLPRDRDDRQTWRG